MKSFINIQNNFIIYRTYLDFVFLKSLVYEQNYYVFGRVVGCLFGI